jgi:hypothetical protein
MSEYYKDENQKYYDQCILNYDKFCNKNTPINNNLITLDYLNELDENEEYKFEISKLIDNLKNYETKQFIPDCSEIYKIDNSELVDLFKIIIPYFEKIYNSYLKIIDMKVLKHLSGNSHKEGAFKWHYDNHPKLIINIMIYLNDVNNDNGEFEYITLDDNIIKFDFSKPAGNRELESFVKLNYDKIKIHKVLGKTGTLFFFDNNIAHRAGPKLNKERTAILLQVFPSLHKIY